MRASKYGLYCKFTVYGYALEPLLQAWRYGETHDRGQQGIHTLLFALYTIAVHCSMRVSDLVRSQTHSCSSLQLRKTPSVILKPLEWCGVDSSFHSLQHQGPCH